MMNQTKAIHLPGLNGLRAFAALAVVVSHLRLAHDQFGLPKTGSLQLAQYGVTIFFALSGFLITFLLLKEKEQTQTVDVKSFYIRRILRIWPLYYFYLALAVLSLWLTQPEALPGQILFYIFMLANVPFIMDKALPKVDHYWSLGVEEQFYLFWPLLMKKLKRPVQFIIGVIVFFTIAKGITGFLKAKYQIEIPYLIFTVVRFDCMAIGALGAFVVHYNKAKILEICHHKISQAFAWITMLLLTFNLFKIHPLVNHSFVAFMTVVAILNVAFNKKTVVGLDHSILDFLGKISFGLYVYHPLVILAAVKASILLSPNRPPSMPLVYIAVIGGTILISHLSYQWLEKPFLKLKDKYAIIPSSGSKTPEKAD